MDRIKKSGFINKAVIGIMLALSAGIGGLYYYNRFSDGIYEYECSTDKQFICSFFKENFYWLVHDYSKTYSPEYMLDNKSPSQRDPRVIGTLKVKTYRIKGRPVGFITYYPSELYSGRILFLGVDKNYRSKGIARKLLSSAFADLKRMGVRTIWINTRTDNTPGRKLYESLGFTEGTNDGAYVDYKRAA
ncbi:GNAT family N-acetyltransferase [Candidatus Dependentiae bacterium]|nr:GNAT family N-acetyltransferase [Candidatus Dependentiae bacterium]